MEREKHTQRGTQTHSKTKKHSNNRVARLSFLNESSELIHWKGIEYLEQIGILAINIWERDFVIMDKIWVFCFDGQA